jgi:hypothetical protein
VGCRDALIGGLLATYALRGRDTRGWFLAAGGEVVGIVSASGARPTTADGVRPCARG